MKLWHLAAIFALTPTIIVGCNLLNKPAALVNKATNTDKMLANYEWFYEANGAYKARTAQIAAHKALIDAEKAAPESDRGELARLNMELAAMQMACREIVGKYSAKSGMVHVGYLKGNSLPESLDESKCK